MPTRQLLRCIVGTPQRSQVLSFVGGSAVGVTEFHIFTTDDTGLVGQAFHLLSASVGISFVHVTSSLTKAHEIVTLGDKRSSCVIDISKHVDR